MKKMCTIACLLVLVAAPRSLEGKDDIHEQSIVSSSLSNPDVLCFAQEPSGRMWIGTERGLNRYNGYDYHQFLHSQDSSSIPDNRIYDISIDPEGRVWVGTEDGVAVYSDKTGFRRVPINSEEKAVWQILTDKRGRIILNLQEDLCVYDTLSGRFEPAVLGFDRFYSYQSRCHIAPDGKMWVVAPREIRCFNTDNFDNLDNIPTLHPVTESIMLDNGEIWMAGEGRISVLDTRRFVFRNGSGNLMASLSGHQVERFFQWDRNHLLLKTSDGKFHLYDREKDLCDVVSPEFFSLPQGFNTKILFKDASGNIWFGSDDKGFRFWPHMGESGPIPHAFDGKSVVSMSLAPDGNLWIMTRHDGLFVVGTQDGSISQPDISAIKGEDHIDYLQSNEPLVFASSAGDIWLVFSNQQRIVQCRYSGGRLLKKAEYPAFYPRGAVEDKDGGIWFGTRNECLLYIAPGSNKAERIQIYPYQTTYIHCLLPLDNKILVGAYDEPLRLIDIHTREIRGLDMAGSDWERCIGTDFFYPTDFLKDSRGDIWIGTRYNGVLQYDFSGKNLHPVPGTPSDDISIIEEDGAGNIWVGTAAGLARYDREEAAFTSIFLSHGMERTFYYDRSSLLLPNGKLLFGGSGGLTLINTPEVPSQASLPLVFDNVTAHGKDVFPLGDKLTLGYRDNSFSVSFSASDFENASRIHYLYKLEGYDKDWVDAGNSREIHFANVPAGRYTLRVRYFLQPDQDAFKEGDLDIRVLPAPWLSWWAKLLYTIAAIVAIVLVIKIRRRIARERAEVEEAQRNMSFFSNIAHEFRTPLTMISGPVSELSQSPEMSAKDRNLLDTVRRSVDRMLSLVNQLMDFGKLEDASLRLRVTKGDIVPVLKESMEIYRANAESLGLTLNLKGMEYPLVTWFDEDKLRKIVGNLLSNAVKFTPKGGTVTMELDQVLRGGEKSYVCITVSDTGEGIPEDKLERIFDRYYRIEGKSKNSYVTGTGIGLYFARSLANLHHGELRAANRTDTRGAVFTLLLPMEDSAYPGEERLLVEEPSVNADYPAETSMESGAVLPDGALPVLLAVDDDPDILRYYGTLFSQAYKVVCASGADEAYRIALDSPPDVVLSDVAMPDKDGFELCRALKSNLQLSHVPVILVTAMGTVKNQVHGLEEGADAYVTKPFDPSYLRALVKSQLENRRRVQNLVNAATDSSEMEDTLSSKDKFFLDSLYSLMERELSNEDLDISHLTDMLGISRTKFYYKIKGLTGKTPSEFFMQYKLNVAAKLLKEGELNVSEIAIKTGFSTLQHFSKAFKKQFGVPPSKYNA